MHTISRWMWCAQKNPGSGCIGVWFCLVLFLIHITYHRSVFKWLTGSSDIGYGSTEPVAFPNILLPTVLNGEGRNGSQVFT